MWEIFDKKKDLAARIHAELEAGKFSPRSEAGSEFYVRFRKDVKSSQIFNNFIKMTQENYNKLKKILDKAP